MTTTTSDQPYATGLTRPNIERALAAAGKETDTLKASDLAMLEDFHSLGRLATSALIDLAQITAGDRVLDAGTGIGGTARLIAAERGARVTAVDLTPEYCEVAQWLNDTVGLGDLIDVRAASTPRPTASSRPGDASRSGTSPPAPEGRCTCRSRGPPLPSRATSSPHSGSLSYYKRPASTPRTGTT